MTGLLHVLLDSSVTPTTLKGRTYWVHTPILLHAVLKIRGFN